MEETLTSLSSNRIKTDACFQLVFIMESFESISFCSNLASKHIQAKAYSPTREEKCDTFLSSELYLVILKKCHLLLSVAFLFSSFRITGRFLGFGLASIHQLSSSSRISLRRCLCIEMFLSLFGVSGYYIGNRWTILEDGILIGLI